MMRKIKTYLATIGLRGTLEALRANARRTPALFEMRWPGIHFPFYLRLPSSDVPTCKQVFINREYDVGIQRSPQTIVDAGANIGLASIYFANIYPEAKIIALEPEESNFELLQRNVVPYPNITPVRAALWNENKKISLVDPGLGHWGFMTEDKASSDSRHLVPAVTVDALMKTHGLERIDILKVDIEGAEREVFANTSAWIDKVDAIIIELHEHMKPGCNRSFYNGTPGFDQEWQQGEHTYLIRHKGCLIKKAA